jgi:hypothetical protein
MDVWANVAVKIVVVGITRLKRPTADEQNFESHKIQN